MNPNKTNYNLQEIEKSNKKQSLLLRHILPNIWILVLIAILLLTIGIIGNYFQPQLLKKALDVNIVNRDVQGLTQTTLIYLALSVFSISFNFLRIRTTGILGQKMLFNIRSEIFRKIQSLPTEFFSDNQSGDIIQRLTGNVEGINSFFSEGLVRMLGISFNILTIGAVMFILDWRLALVSVIGGILMLIFLAVQGEMIEKPISTALKREADISSKIQESMDGFIAIKMQNQTSNWNKYFGGINNNFYNISKKVAFLTSLSNGYLGAITLLGIGITLILSLKYFSLGEITLGTVVIFISYATRFFGGFNGISDIWRNVKTGLESANRLEAVLSLENNIVSEKKAYHPNTVKGDIEFKDVDFSYDDQNKVLEDINLKAKAGQTVAIVGPTGAGKTTFVNLIARLYDVDNGKIFVDGVDVKDWNLDTLRDSIGYLIQDTFLFEDTILNNLRYDNDSLSEKECLEMFTFLGAEKFINSLEKGLHTKLTDKAENISSGQRQIVALARILLRDPKILILDEATARIDTKSEKMLQSAISKATGGRTTFIIAHRLSTIFNADNIVLISNSKILEQGTHKELINKKGAYYEMYSKFVGDDIN
jgi:ATP-binding cassette subfamily B protein